MRRKPRLRLSLSKRRLKRLDMVSLIAILLLALYLGLVEDDSALMPNGEVNTLSGRAEITDGDSIKIKGERIRLVGIDAPETAQTCLDEQKKDHPCGRLATQYLASLINNRPVTCRWHERDRYNRILGACQADNDDLNKLMVENGWAVSYYSSAYANEQKLARRQKRGMWIWRVKPPQQWRRENPRL